MVAKTIILALFLTGWAFNYQPVEVPAIPGPPGKPYQCDNGKIRITSTAPLEFIEAQSTRLRGILNPDTQEFAWSVDVKTIKGFNNPLQEEHFNENYLESDQFPQASFTGKIIEKTDFSKDGVYFVRAKGMFAVHGVAQERIIKSKIEIKGGKIVIHATFKMLLADHDINIPRVVYQKIAEEVDITVDADLKWKI
jgi:hypothetical protein